MRHAQSREPLGPAGWQKGVFAAWFRLKEGNFILWGQGPCVVVALLDPWVCFCDLNVKLSKAVSELAPQAAMFQWRVRAGLHLRPVPRARHRTDALCQNAQTPPPFCASGSLPGLVLRWGSRGEQTPTPGSGPGRGNTVIRQPRHDSILRETGVGRSPWD